MLAAVLAAIRRRSSYCDERVSGRANQKSGGEHSPPLKSTQKRPKDGQLTGGSATAGNEAFALCTLASKLADAANGFCLFASALLRGLLVVVTHFHFPENAFALHLLLQSAESLIDVIVADKYLHVNPVPLVFELTVPTLSRSDETIAESRASRPAIGEGT
jgi:hypothetical protein